MAVLKALGPSFAPNVIASRVGILGTDNKRASVRRGAPVSIRAEVERAGLTVEETAFRVGVSRRTIYTLLETGELPSYVIGRARRIPTDAVEELISSRTTTRWSAAG